MLKSFLEFFWEITKIVIIAFLIVIPIRYFIFQPFLVRGQSMVPTFQHGDYLIVDEISYRFREPTRGEVVVFKSPLNLTQRYIKRIIGLPGETVEIKDGQVFIYFGENPQVLDESSYLSNSMKTPGKIKISLNPGEYFVLGDNRLASSDSRRWGSLPRKNIVGRVFLRLWPLNSISIIKTPVY